MIDSKALGKDEGAPATDVSKKSCGCGTEQYCERCEPWMFPPAIPDHPQSTKEVANGEAGARAEREAWEFLIADSIKAAERRMAENPAALGMALAVLRLLPARVEEARRWLRRHPGDAAAPAEPGASATPLDPQTGRKQMAEIAKAREHDEAKIAHDEQRAEMRRLFGLGPLPPARPAEPRALCECGHRKDQHAGVLGCTASQGHGNPAAEMSVCACGRFRPAEQKQLGKEGVGAALIAAERVRQMECEGWTTAHDAQHVNGEMALAAACYATPAPHRKMLPSEGYPLGWPPEWGASWWKPAPISIIDQSGYEQPTAADRIRELSKAGALLAAEIDRLSLLRSDGPSTPRPVYDGDVSWRRIAGVGAAPEGEQEERACYHCDRAIMVPAGSPRIYTCGQCEDSAPDLSEVFAPPSATERQDSPARAAPKAGETQPPSADELGKLLDRAAPGADYLAASLRGQFPMRAEAAGPRPSEFEPCPACGGRAEDHGTMGDCPAAAVPEAGAPLLHRMLEKATVRLEILRDRAEGCDGLTAKQRAWQKGHALTRLEVPGWVKEQRDLLLAVSMRALSSPSGDARPPDNGCGKKHLGCHCERCRAALSAASDPLRAELRRLALAFATEGSRYERAGNVSGAAQMRRVSNLLYALEKSGTAVVFTPVPGDEEAEIEKLKAAHVADRRKIMESAKLLLADKDAAEAEVLRLTKERDFEREQRDLRHAAWLEERASVKALREALEAAIAAQRYQAEASPAVYEGGTLAEPEIDAIDMCAACGDGDWPCVNPACWVSRGLALLAPPNPSAEKLTPGPRE